MSEPYDPYRTYIIPEASGRIVSGEVREVSFVDRPARKDSKIATMQKLVIGFTGTRKGMTPIASARLAALITSLNPSEAHHGDCAGADEEFHTEVTDWVPECRMVVHPGSVRGTGNFRANCTSKNQITHPTKPALQRNKDIVNAIDVLIAAPSSHHEMVRSGTWATIRYARAVRRPIITIYPDGRIDMDFPAGAQVPSLQDRRIPRTLSGDYASYSDSLREAISAMEKMKAVQVASATRDWGSFIEIIKQPDPPKWVSERRSEDTSSDPS